MQRVITLTTDFGTSDGFVGAMKGVILGHNPHAVIVDISHDIAPQDIAQGAYVLASACDYFPAGTIHVVVVDPGVGSARRPLAIRRGETFFVGPDNGVLSLALQTPGAAPGAADDLEAVHLSNRAYWLPRLCATFHGRDLFAPVAAHLSRGIRISELGDPLTDWVRLAAPVATARAGKEIVGQIVHIDRFGNAITNIPEQLLAQLDYLRVVIRVGAHVLRGIQPSYAAALPGQALALISSSWHLELAVRDGSAARQLELARHDQVIITEQSE